MGYVLPVYAYYLFMLNLVSLRAAAKSPLPSQEKPVQGGGKDHLPATDHAPPPAVRGDVGVVDGREVCSVSHPNY